MIRTAIVLLALACGTVSAAAGTFDSPANCAVSEGDLQHVPDCMRMGRHVRVGPSISRGTATLHDGVTATGVSADEAAPLDERRRVRVESGAAGFAGTGIFAR